jgi:hypothetical protein
VKRKIFAPKLFRMPNAMKFLKFLSASSVHKCKS